LPVMEDWVPKFMELPTQAPANAYD
jgi:hypothetical protein